MPTETRLHNYKGLFTLEWPAGSGVPGSSRLISRTTSSPATDDIVKPYPVRVFHYGFQMPRTYSREILCVGPLAFSCQYTQRPIRPGSGATQSWFAVGEVDCRYGVRLKDTGMGFEIPAGFANAIPEFAWPSTSDRWAAEIDCLNKLKNVKFNSTTFAAELKRTLGDVAAKCVTLARATSAARRGRWRTVTKTLGIKRHTFKSSRKEAANRWLEVQYGWLPLLSDIYEAHEQFFEEGAEVPLSARVFRGVKSKKDHTGKPIPDKLYTVMYDSLGVDSTPSQVPIEYEYASGVVVRLDYVLDRVALKSLTAIGLTDPASTAWELVPWSFVVDWTIPIGDWLSSLSATLGLSFRAGSYTYISKFRGTATVSRERVRFDSHDQFSGMVFGTAPIQRMRMNRVTYNGTPFPLPSFKSPFTSAKRAANALALVQQNLRALK